MRTAFTAVSLSLALSVSLFGTAQAEGLRFSAKGARVSAEAMSVFGQVCRPQTVEMPSLELRIVDRRGEVVAIQPLELHTPSTGGEAGCAYYGLAVAVGLTEAAEVCVTGVGETAGRSDFCSPLIKG